MTIEVQPLVDDADIEAWRYVHNTVIPSHLLSVGDVRERLTRNCLSLAFADGQLVGNATVRPGAPGTPPTVIVRILPAHRRQGYGSDYWRQIKDADASLRKGPVATVVLTANDDGLRFAEALGFIEVERYEVDGAEYADMQLHASPDDANSAT